MPKLIDCTTRTLLFDDGSTIDLLPCFADVEPYLSPVWMLWMRPKQIFTMVSRGDTRDDVEHAIGGLIDDLNEETAGQVLTRQNPAEDRSESTLSSPDD